MSKKHKAEKKQALAQKKLYEGEVLVDETENIKEVESGVIEENDEAIAVPSDESEPLDSSLEDATKASEEVEKTEETAVKAESKGKNKKEAVKTDEKKDAKDNKKTDKKKKTKKKGLVKKTKETASELKKVTWPSFGEVVKKTGIVIAFVVIFGLLIFGVDTLLGFLSSLLV